jgi:hypothetical protein
VPKEVRELARTHTEAAINRLAFWMQSEDPRASVHVDEFDQMTEEELSAWPLENVSKLGINSVTDHDGYDVTTSLKWQRDGGNWLLLCNRRHVGRVVPDSRYPKMYRSVRAGGRLSDMANLSRAKDAALGAAIRELAWDTANNPRKAQQIGGVFSASLPPMRPIGPPATTLARACLTV